jgi:hypothetical protein
VSIFHRKLGENGDHSIGPERLCRCPLVIILKVAAGSVHCLQAALCVALHTP